MVLSPRDINNPPKIVRPRREIVQRRRHQYRFLLPSRTVHPVMGSAATSTPKLISNSRDILQPAALPPLRICQRSPPVTPPVIGNQTDNGNKNDGASTSTPIHGFPTTSTPKSVTLGGIESRFVCYRKSHPIDQDKLSSEATSSCMVPRNDLIKTELPSTNDPMVPDASVKAGNDLIEMIKNNGDKNIVVKIGDHHYLIQRLGGVVQLDLNN